MTSFLLSLKMFMLFCFVLICIGYKQVVFKMDRYGKGEEIVLNNIFDSVARTPSFQNFDMELFRGGFTVTKFSLYVFYGKKKSCICDKNLKGTGLN